MPTHQEKTLRAMFEATVAAAMPYGRLADYLPPRPKGRCLVVGAGKAAASMAAEIEALWGDQVEGLVVTRYAHGLPTRAIEVIEAGHPNPDDASQKAAKRILELAQGLTEDDLMLCLISGGGSALLALPAEGLTLADKQAVTRSLLQCGATISEMNCLRKHLSAIKGGRLAQAAAPAAVVTLMISDVPGDDPAVIASGPTVEDATTCRDALEVLDRYGLTPPAAIRACLESGTTETPKPGSLPNSTLHMISTPQDALDAAAVVAQQAGYTPLILGNALEGEARDVALVHAAIARQIKGWSQPAKAPCALISGGETTVSIKGTGRGGRNAEFLLALAVALKGEPGVHALAADTDGIDGVEDNAGAILRPDSWNRALSLNLKPASYLDNNDSYGFFHALDDLIITGPTRTNVNDFRVLLID